MKPETTAAEELYRNLFEASADSIVVCDEEGRIVMTNPAAERLLGHPAAALLGRPIEVVIPSRISVHEQHRAAFVASPRPRPMGLGLSLSALRADGREIPVDVSLTPLHTGGRCWVAAAIRDLRGRPQGPDALRVQATALRSAANGIVITDWSGTITWVNPAACVITGYSADEIIGQHTRILRSGQHDQAFYASLWQTITRGETWSGTIINRRKDGSLYPEEQTIAPVLDDTGQTTHYIAIKQDVSGRRAAEEALARTHAELARRVAEIESLNRKLHEAAIRDPLTGLFNRRYLEEVIARDVARARRSGEPLAVTALDLDRFKEVNDTWGHPAGDLVLRALARTLLSKVRRSDLVCRTGGEEFVVILPGSTLEAAHELAETWRSRFAASEIDTGTGSTVRCTVSIGVALFRAHQEKIEETMGRADAALYEAKRLGRNRVVAEPAAPGSA
ncbi:MAG TPA: diguanylate cyclase [Thermoanaerobaculia bacterium]|nr:diguanylate cyclase [Thermoanaerobaculia bacterium]